MFKIKGCSACSGDLVFRGDSDGYEWHCLQGGHDFPVKRIKPQYTPSGLDIQLAMGMTDAQTVWSRRKAA